MRSGMNKIQNGKKYGIILYGILGILFGAYVG